MSSDQAAIYYLAINGQPQGPFSAAMVMNQLRQGSIDGNTLICAEGGAAWLPVQQMAAVLSATVYAQPPMAPAQSGSGAPSPAAAVSPAGGPPPATGYGSTPVHSPAPSPAPVIEDNAPANPVRHHTPRSFQPQPFAAKAPVDNSKGLRLTALLAAIGCFFLPWLEFSCSGKPIVSQTGIQTILNKGTPDETFLNMAQDMSAQRGNGLPPGMQDGSENMGDDVGSSIAAGAALVSLTLAFLAALGNSGRGLSGAMAGVALGCLLIPALTGFPLEDNVKKELDKSLGQATGNARAKSGARSSEEAAQTQMGIEFGASMAKDMFKVKYTPWFYVELGALGVACLMGMSGGGSRAKR